MKKIIYSITKLTNKGATKITGIGYITDKDIIVACNSKNNKPYVRIFEDAIKYCHPKVNAADEFIGSYYEMQECEFEENGKITKREIELDYYISYKLVK